MLFAMLVRLAPDAELDPGRHASVAEGMRARLSASPGVRWVASYAVVGPCDFLEIFEAADEVGAVRASAIFRSAAGECSTETWTLIPLAGEGGRRFGDALASATGPSAHDS